MEGPHLECTVRRFWSETPLFGSHRGIPVGLTPIGMSRRWWMASAGGGVRVVRGRRVGVWADGRLVPRLFGLGWKDAAATVLVARYLTAAGIEVVEVNRPNRQLRRLRGGKSDSVDAEGAARAAASGQATADPVTAPLSA